MGEAKQKESPDIVVFRIVRDSECAECHRELAKGRMLRMENGNPLCLSCADLDHLVFLPSGDTALTRRASKHSSLRAVVVQFSRARKRYERQGVLVEQPALNARNGSAWTTRRAGGAPGCAPPSAGRRRTRST